MTRSTSNARRGPPAASFPLITSEGPLIGDWLDWLQWENRTDAPFRCLPLFGFSGGEVAGNSFLAFSFTLQAPVQDRQNHVVAVEYGTWQLVFAANIAPDFMPSRWQKGPLSSPWEPQASSPREWLHVRHPNLTVPRSWMLRKEHWRPRSRTHLRAAASRTSVLACRKAPPPAPGRRSVLRGIVRSCVDRTASLGTHMACHSPDSLFL